VQEPELKLTAVDDAIQLGIFEGQVIEKLTALVKRSAKCTHDLGNRRFGDLIFDTRGSEVHHVSLRMESAVCMTCFGRKKLDQFEACYHCDGDGCQSCGSSGGTTVQLPCYDCK
jgi:hypothetical protein